MPSLLDRLPFRRRRAGDPLSAATSTLAEAAPDVAKASVKALERARGAPVAAPVLILATGAGVAVWWWTQWARGRAESDAAATADKTD
jgi:uncharacterized protein HemX